MIPTMHRRTSVKVFLVQVLTLLALVPQPDDCLIITSVIAGNKKFKTISFDTPFIKPLMFERDMPSTEFRRHRVVRPPKFDIDVNIPIKLPLEDEYPQEPPKKQVTSDFFFQTDEVREPGYKGPKISYENKGQDTPRHEPESYPASKAAPVIYRDEMAASASSLSAQRANPPATYHPASSRPQWNPAISQPQQIQPRSDVKGPETKQQVMSAQESMPRAYVGQDNYQQQTGYNNQPEFIPGGFVNLKLSGPSGGPKYTHEDSDRERWSVQMGQTQGAMPFPILNYNQLQNFYGGLGTFTNGLAENRYVETSLMDMIKSKVAHFTDKFHFKLG